MLGFCQAGGFDVGFYSLPWISFRTLKSLGIPMPKTVLDIKFGAIENADTRHFLNATLSDYNSRSIKGHCNRRFSLHRIS